MVNEVENIINGTTVQDLRNLADHIWNKICIPLVCKIYLKELVKNSQNLSSKQVLECDFNNGLEIQLNPKQLQMQQKLFDFGFNEASAFEAIIVSGNFGLQTAVQYLLLNKDDKFFEYHKQKKLRKKWVPINRHYTIINQQLKEINQQKRYKKMKMSELDFEITTLKMKLKDLQNKNIAFKKDLNKMNYVNKLAKYKEYLEGILASGDSISISKITHLKQYQTDNNISDNEHKQTLKALGITEKLFEQYKLNGINSNASNGEDTHKECVLCYDDDRCMLITPCNHIALCESCVKDNYTPYNQHTCPICMNKIDDIQKVYL